MSDLTSSTPFEESISYVHIKPDEALGLQGEDAVPIDHWDFSRAELMASQGLYMWWGANTLWMTVLGMLVW
jgi:hypothetical protein